MTIYFDSSTLISLALTCNLPYLKEIKKLYDGDFAITSTVYKEIITRSMQIERFKYEAYRIKRLLDEGIVVVKDDKQYFGKVKELMNLINKCFYARDRPLKIVHPGEISVIPLTKKGDVLAMDERTTRYLVESPEKLQGLLERKMHTRVTVDNNKLDQVKRVLSGLDVIRSTELALVAYEKGYIGKKNRDLFNGLLWALKLNGCAISSGEIKNYVRKYG
jgi:hypothetical protein